jgi:ankyrin repeat protein
LLALKRKRDPEFSIDTKDLDGRTFAHVAASAGRLVILKYLGETEKANMAVKDSRGRIPLHDACENGNVLTIKYLMRKGEKANVVTNGHDTPLLYFVRGFHPFEVFTEVVKLLLDASCEIDTQNIDGNTALHLILKMQQKDEGKSFLFLLLLLLFSYTVPPHLKAIFLLSNGASPNIVDKHGEMCLHLAAKIGDIELANKLLECGADVSIQSPKGTAEQIANANGYIALAKLFAARLLSMAQKNVVQQAPRALKTQPVCILPLLSLSFPLSTSSKLHFPFFFLL